MQQSAAAQSGNAGEYIVALEYCGSYINNAYIRSQYVTHTCSDCWSCSEAVLGNAMPTLYTHITSDKIEMNCPR